MGHSVIPHKVFVKTLIMLLLLTIVTVLVARPVSGMDFGFLNTIVAMAIATVKASLVLAFFMQLKYDDKLYLVLTLSGVFFVILLFAFSYIDIITRVVEKSAL